MAGGSAGSAREPNLRFRADGAVSAQAHREVLRDARALSERLDAQLLRALAPEAAQQTARPLAAARRGHGSGAPHRTAAGLRRDHAGPGTPMVQPQPAGHDTLL